MKYLKTNKISFDGLPIYEEIINSNKEMTQRKYRRLLISIRDFGFEISFNNGYPAWIKKFKDYEIKIIKDKYEKEFFIWIQKSGKNIEVPYFLDHKWLNMFFKNKLNFVN